MAKKPESVLSKPTLSTAAVLSFAEGAQQAQGTSARGRPQDEAKAPQNANKRYTGGLVPDGDARLIANIRKDLHRKLKVSAAERGTTMSKLIEDLVEKHL